MAISRRRLLVAGAAGAAAAAVNPLGAVLGVARAAPPGGVTTLDLTVQLGSPGPGGYRKLVAGPGEPHITRTDLVSVYSPLIDRPLIAFAQMSDLHIIDDQSPLRTEFLDRYADPALGGYSFSSAYRAQECMSTQLTDAMCRAIANLVRGPATELPLAHVLVTGDMVDNAQYNEVRWYINLLDGRVVYPASAGGHEDQSVTGDFFGLDRNYWHPAHRQTELQNGGLDNNLAAGFPDVTNLPQAARQGFEAHGLRLPWYAAYGNHDRNVQGNADPGMLLLGDVLNNIAVGNSKPIDISYSPPSDGEAKWYHWLAAASSKVCKDVRPDPARRLLSRQEFMSEHFQTWGQPVGHGFANVANDADYLIPSGPDELIQFICLDTTESNSSDGSLDPEQYDWLHEQLVACSSRYELRQPPVGNIEAFYRPEVRDKLVVIFCHHTLDTMGSSGGGLRQYLLGFPNVIMMVNGHTHKNKVTAHRRLEDSTFPDGGFWEINTASHIDWPIQSRLIEVAEGEGTLAITSTMVDIDAPLSPSSNPTSPSQLASLARELAANDLQKVAADGGGVDASRGGPEDRNTRLLLPMPFRVPVRPSRITVARDGIGRLTVFALDKDGLVFHRTQPRPNDPYPAWDQLNGEMMALSAETNVDGRMQLFALHSTTSIGHRWQNTPGGSWSKWHWLDGHLSTIATTRDTSGRIELFGTNADGGVFTRRQATPGGQFEGWTQLSGTMYGVAVETNANGSTALFATNPWGRVFQRVRHAPGGTWSDWLPLYGQPGKLSSISVVKRPDDRLSVIGTDQLGRIWRSTQTAPNATTWSVFAHFSQQNDLGFNSAVAAQVNLNGSVHIHSISQTSQVAHAFLTDGSSAWVPAPDMVPVMRTVPDLDELYLDEATAALEAIYLNLGTYSIEIVNESYDDGRVIGQSRNAGSTIPTGSSVNLTIGENHGGGHQ